MIGVLRPMAATWPCRSRMPGSSDPSARPSRVSGFIDIAASPPNGAHASCRVPALACLPYRPFSLLLDATRVAIRRHATRAAFQLRLSARLPACLAVDKEASVVPDADNLYFAISEFMAPT